MVDNTSLDQEMAWNVKHQAITWTHSEEDMLQI